MFKKILVANRGEIAVRIMRACRELGISTVAVYSEADSQALHVLQADESYCIGAAPPGESYLNIERIIDAANKAGAEAIHPGYGFLAENASFAKSVGDAGLVFIGPPAEAIELMGSKVASRKTVMESGVPVIPGTTASSEDLALLKAEALKIGFPLLIKASAGGGGKGMRILHQASELDENLQAAMREAKSAFGDPTVYIEKYLEEPRHIEFQVLGDMHGTIINLFERECSIQRRHQKIIEETPSPVVTPVLRSRMGEAAVKAAQACGYYNAGTVEFLVDKNGNFYFLEMNTRIQVEHPITELVVGIDLVKEQIRIASGEKLHLRQDHLSQRGSAIECRIYAEDAANNFLPSSGKILFCFEPWGPGIRCDSGIYSGCQVSVYYDPILAKLVTWDKDRESARKRMIQALRDYVILGIKTNIPYLIDILEHPRFIDGKIDTDFLPRNMPNWAPREPSDEHIELAIAAAALYEHSFASKPHSASASKTAHATSPWQTIGAWEICASR